MGWDPTRVSRRQRFDDPRDASKKISGAWIGLCASGDCQLLVGFGHHTACFIAKTGTRSKCPPSSLAFTHDCHPVRYLNPRFGLKGPLGRVLAFLVHGAHCSSPLVAKVDHRRRLNITLKALCSTTSPLPRFEVAVACCCPADMRRRRHEGDFEAGAGEARLLVVTMAWASQMATPSPAGLRKPKTASGLPFVLSHPKPPPFSCRSISISQINQP